MQRFTARISLSFECRRNLHDFCHVRKRGKDGEPPWQCPCSCHRDDERVIEARKRKPRNIAKWSR